MGRHIDSTCIGNEFMFGQYCIKYPKNLKVWGVRRIWEIERSKENV